MWVPVSFSAYLETPVAAYQAALEPARPLTSLSIAERDRALVEVGQQLKAATWALSIRLSEPATTHGIHADHKLALRGQVHFRARGAAARTQSASVRMALGQQGIQIVPFVLSGSSDWWPQAKPVLGDDGRFEAEVYVGDAAGHAKGKDFVVVVCAVAQGAVTWNKPVAELPVARIESDRITATRV